MSMPQQSQTNPRITWANASTRSVDVSGTKFVYRQLGAGSGVPVIFLNHLAAKLDRWDPRVVDGIDAVAFIRALGLEQVDLLGFSLGGFISQVIAQEEPLLVRKVILAGTGPAGGAGIDKVTSVTFRDMIKGALTFKHPEYYLFFTETANGRSAARDFLVRLKERTENRDTPVSIPTFITQLKAIRAWAHQTPDDLARIRHPVLVANGDQDKMVPSSNSVDLARRLSNAELVLYDDAGHGGIFQYHEAFVNKALEFLES